ncbi:hypothetical protein, partial [Salmonella enterica]|uniref:hypothetical protein n=1 Tax=Salmonella enterica TaxID=28901 RepID=UPI003297F764
IAIAVNKIRFFFILNSPYIFDIKKLPSFHSLLYNQIKKNFSMPHFSIFNTTEKTDSKAGKSVRCQFYRQHQLFFFFLKITP